MLSFILSLSVSLVGAFDDKDDAGKKELEKIQGVWTCILHEADGNRAPEGVLKQIKVICKDDRYTEKIGDEIVEAGTHRLDPTKKPKQMDIVVTEGMFKGEKQLAIYELEGDKLKVCAAAHGSKERPTKFEAPAGSGCIYLVLKKDK